MNLILTWLVQTCISTRFASNYIGFYIWENERRRQQQQQKCFLKGCTHHLRSLKKAIKLNSCHDFEKFSIKSIVSWPSRKSNNGLFGLFMSVFFCVRMCKGSRNKISHTCLRPTHSLFRWHRIYPSAKRTLYVLDIMDPYCYYLDENSCVYKRLYRGSH